MKTRRAALYVRVSSGKQNTEPQEKALREYVQRRGWAVHKLYRDKGVSGATASRPALNPSRVPSRSEGQGWLVQGSEKSLFIAMGASHAPTADTSGERDLSWLDLTVPLAISPDGKQVLLDEQSKQAGSDYWVGLRNMDGSSPVRLGDGWGVPFRQTASGRRRVLIRSPSQYFCYRLARESGKSLNIPELAPIVMPCGG
jgi:hypothetical protein